jgi:hypothetical protein
VDWGAVDTTTVVVDNTAETEAEVGSWWVGSSAEAGRVGSRVESRTGSCADSFMAKRREGVKAPSPKLGRFAANVNTRTASIRHEQK